MNDSLSRRDLLGLFGRAAASAPLVLIGCELPGIDPGAPLKPAAAKSPVMPLAKTLTFRRSADRGWANRGWLEAKHTFSFSRYQDPNHMSFRALRVLNEDRVAAGQGFPMHPHKDMEILTYVLDGALSHQDSLGNGGVIRPGEVQTMSAGSGIRHSEFNPSGSEPVHLLQIWVMPDKSGHEPRYAQKKIAHHQGKNPVTLIASADGAQGSVMMHQDLKIYAVKLQAQQEAFFEVRPGRHAWVQTARGKLSLNKTHTLYQGDGVSTSDAGGLLFSASQKSEFLIFDLA